MCILRVFQQDECRTEYFVSADLSHDTACVNAGGTPEVPYFCAGWRMIYNQVLGGLIEGEIKPILLFWRFVCILSCVFQLGRMSHGILCICHFFSRHRLRECRRDSRSSVFLRRLAHDIQSSTQPGWSRNRIHIHEHHLGALLTNVWSLPSVRGYHIESAEWSHDSYLRCRAGDLLWWFGKQDLSRYCKLMCKEGVQQLIR